MLRKDKVDLFGKPTFERIINDKAIQEDILELSPQELQTYKYIMNYNTTDINEHLGRRINPYFCQINNISDLQALPVEQRTKAISILLSDTEFYLTDLSQLDQYYNKRKEIYQNVINKPEIIEEQLDKDSEEILSYFILTEMEELSYIDRIRYSILDTKYGISLENAKILCNAFGEDIDKLDDSQEKRIVQELKAILQENNIEKLRNIDLNEDYRNYEGTLNIFSNLKNAYLRKYKETLYQLKDNDYIETQSTKIRGKKKNIRIYNILGKNNDNADFSLIVTSLGGIFSNTHDYGNFKDDWYRADENHTISCSYIRNDNLSVVNTSNLLAFSDIADNQLLQARNQDAGTIDLAFFDPDELAINKFLAPENMINQTKNYNELLVERKVTKEGKLINRKPSFVVFMAESLEDINDKKNERWQNGKKMAGELDIPIAVIDVTKCTELEFAKIQEMVELVKKDYRIDLIPTILQKIENNKAAQLGEPEITRIRDKIFSDKTIKSILNQIIQAINDSSKEKANEGIEAFVKQTKKFQKIYQENKYANNCKTYNYDEYIAKLKTLYMTKNLLYGPHEYVSLQESTKENTYETRD